MKKNQSVLLAMLLAMVIVLFLSSTHNAEGSPGLNTQKHSANSVTTAQDNPESGESGESSSPQPTQVKKADKEAEKKFATWQILLLIFAPILVIAVAVIIMIITGSLGEKDTSHIEDRDKKKKGKIGSLKTKRERRLQLALELLDYQKIARMGTLKTDYFFHCAEGSNKGENFKINKYSSKLGRRSTDGRINDIQISSFEKKVSRSQGLVVFHDDEDRFYLINESDVRIKVNKEWVRSAYPLREGDRILLGDETVVLVFCRERIEVT
ncbi:MAG: FHA domain-containing protein [Candidatus Eremiobacteraeota bacterium]|nr:FHA domain-containing protein [Candidatus Eremiobacteraeota bacterium]